MEERTIKKNKRRIIRIRTIILIILVILCLYKPIEKQVLLMFYPCQYHEYVEKYADIYEVDPLLIYAIIKAESNFNPDSTSTSGAKGLMQIMENTAQEVMDKNTEIEYQSEEAIYEVENNIQIGTKYFSTLMNYYNGNIYLSLAAYNAGMGNVAKWIESGTIQEDGSDIENIPFKETNNYVRKTIRNYRIYQELYR